MKTDWEHFKASVSKRTLKGVHSAQLFKITEFDYKLVCCQFDTTYYVAINKIIHVYFSHITYLISHVTYLNNTCGWSYKLSRSGL